MPSLCCGPKWLSLSAAVRAPPSAHAQASACVCAWCVRVCTVCVCVTALPMFIHTCIRIVSYSPSPSSSSSFAHSVSYNHISPAPKHTMSFVRSFRRWREVDSKDLMRKRAMECDGERAIK